MAPADPEHVRRLIAGLDSNRFAVREKAYRELLKLGDLAGPILRQASAGTPSLETRRRIDQLLADLHRPPRSPAQIQTLRAIAVLEYIGTPEARLLLRSLAEGAPETRVTREALAAQKRLGK